jgi:septal ring factor EnvC (AmiA/AmiB activator)
MDPNLDGRAPQLPPMPEFRKGLGFWKRFFHQKEAVTGLVLTSACLFLSLRILNDKKRIEAATVEWEKVNQEVQKKKDEVEKLSEENRGLRIAMQSLRERVLNEMRSSGRRLPPLETRVGDLFQEIAAEAPSLPSKKEVVNESAGVHSALQAPDSLSYVNWSRMFCL